MFLPFRDHGVIYAKRSILRKPQSALLRNGLSSAQRFLSYSLIDGVSYMRDMEVSVGKQVIDYRTSSRVVEDGEQATITEHASQSLVYCHKGEGSRVI